MLVLVSLCYFATGSMQRVTGDLHKISQASTSRCMNAVEAFIYALLARTYLCISQAFMFYPVCIIYMLYVPGRGVFACLPIEAGAFIAQYCGKIMSDKEGKRRKIQHPFSIF